MALVNPRTDFAAINGSQVWLQQVRPLIEYVRDSYRAAAEGAALGDPVMSAAYTNRAAALDEILRMPEEAAKGTAHEREEEAEEKHDRRTQRFVPGLG
jgi:hypothetical protein